MGVCSSLCKMCIELPLDIVLVLKKALVASSIELEKALVGETLFG